MPNVQPFPAPYKVAAFALPLGTPTLGAGGITPTASVNFAKGNSSGTEVNHVEAVLSAGGTATVVTPGALTLQGATLSANSVKLNVGSLTIASEQDTSAFASKEKSIGASLSLSPSGQLSGGLNLGSTKQNGAFASVAEQSGVFAGKGGFDIRVSASTTLTGAVIASNAPAALNRLETAMLSATDIHNHESYSASTTSIGVGFGANLSKDAKGNINTDGTGSPLPGIKTGIGTFSATPPVALSASGHQSGVTQSAIAPGSIVITPASAGAGLGDTASLTTAATISRDTAGANAGALTQEFTAAKRREIAQGFEAVRLLTNETATFFANRASEADAKKKEADGLTEAADKARTAGNFATAANLDEQASALQLEAIKIESKFGPSGTYRQVLTALTAAAGGSITSGLSNLVKNAAVNILQQKGAELIGDLVKDGKINQAQATLLHALTGCAGGLASSSSSCGASAAGQGGSAIINALLSSVDSNGAPLSNEEAEARSALVQSIVGLIGVAADVEGSELAGAIASAQAETENNFLGRQQLLAQRRELAECKGSTGCQIGVYAKYTSISVAQDGAIVVGIPIGASRQIFADLTGLYELVKDPKAAYDAVKALATDPEVRKQLGKAVLVDIDSKLATFNRALEYGGLGNAEAAGEVIGSVAVTLAGAATGAYGVVKGAAKVAVLGVKLTKSAAEAAETVLIAQKAAGAAKIAAAARAVEISGATDAEAGLGLGAEAATTLAADLKSGKIFIDAPQVAIKFGAGIKTQGFGFEKLLKAIGDVGAKLEDGSKTFDFWNSTTKTATSAKTIELLTDARLRSPNAVFNALKKYVDAAVDYNKTRSTIDLDPSNILHRELIVGVQAGGTPGQRAQLLKLADYAATRGLSVKIVTLGN